MPTVVDDELAALLAGQYEPIRWMARGGMAEVWEADDLASERRVALKVLKAASERTTHRVRFFREYCWTRSLHHPSFLQMYDYRAVGDLRVIVMEYVEGATLHEHIEDAELLTVSECVAIAMDLLEAVEVMHAAGIVHRDLKPSNIILGDDGQLRLIDLGVAFNRACWELDTEEMPVCPWQEPELNSNLTLVNGPTCTAGYGAPEHALGLHPDFRTDIYSFGVVLYEMLVGERPFTSQSFLSAHIQQTTIGAPWVCSKRDNVPPGLAAVVQRCLESKPYNRFQTVAELKTALEGAMG